jgi:uncharacterized protein (TIGR02266 family)
MPSEKKDRRTSKVTVDDERRDRGADRRQSRRILVDLEVDYQCEETFLFAYITDMSAFGIFIRTNNPEPAGTHLRMRFKLPDLTEPLAVEGEVIWINAFRPGDFNSINPGMGIRFVDLTDEDKDELMDLIKKIAYLEDHTDDDEEQQAPAAEDTSDTADVDEDVDEDVDDGVDRSSVN